MGKKISATVAGVNARRVGDFAALLNGSGEFRCRAVVAHSDQPMDIPGNGSEMAFLFPPAEFPPTGAWLAALRPVARMLLLLDDVSVSRLVLLSALEAGADGILSWPCSVQDVWQAHSVVQRGGTPIPPPLTTLLLERLRSGRHVNPDWHLLTPREAGLMAAIASGLSHKLVALQLGLKVGTVRNHVNHVYAKLGAHSCTDALAKLFGPTPPSPTPGRPLKAAPLKN